MRPSAAASCSATPTAHAAPPGIWCSSSKYLSTVRATADPGSRRVVHGTKHHSVYAITGPTVRAHPHPALRERSLEHKRCVQRRQRELNLSDRVAVCERETDEIRPARKCIHEPWRGQRDNTLLEHGRLLTGGALGYKEVDQQGLAITEGLLEAKPFVARQRRIVVLFKERTHSLGRSCKAEALSSTPRSMSAVALGAAQLFQRDPRPLLLKREPSPHGLEPATFGFGCRARALVADQNLDT